jgi:hypothetical protein
MPMQNFTMNKNNGSTKDKNVRPISKVSNKDCVISKRVLNNILNFSGALLIYKLSSLNDSMIEIILN